MTKKTTIVKPPQYPSPPCWAKKIFLAGSIDMGRAEDWQVTIEKELDTIDRDIWIYNPRRDDWDASWKQEKNNANFYEQVTWELTNLDEVDVIAMFLASDTLSPISLLELGLYATRGKLVVCCPEGFWRNGNVDIVCSKYGIPIFTNKEAWLVEIKNRLR
jgi:hypothetical protein